jgi:hypothetical protein
VNFQSGSDAKAEPFYPAKKYEEAIKEAITSEYDPEVGNQINQVSFLSNVGRRIILNGFFFQRISDELN